MSESKIQIPDKPKAASSEVIGFDVVIPAASKAITSLKVRVKWMQCLSWLYQACTLVQQQP